MLVTFQQTMERFCRHTVNIHHQYREYGSKCRQTNALSALIWPRTTYPGTQRGSRLFLLEVPTGKSLCVPEWCASPAARHSILHHIRFPTVRPLWNLVMTQLHSMDRRRISQCFQLLLEDEIHTHCTHISLFCVHMLT